MRYCDRCEHDMLLLLLLLLFCMCMWATTAVFRLAVHTEANNGSHIAMPVVHPAITMHASSTT